MVPSSAVLLILKEFYYMVKNFKPAPIVAKSYLSMATLAGVERSWI